MKHVVLMGLVVTALLAGIALAAPARVTLTKQQEHACGPQVMAVIDASHTAGYQDGYLDGRASIDGPQLPQCQRALSYVEGRARKASEYEDCLIDIRNATSQNDIYLRTVVAQCVALLPLGK